MHIAHWRNHDRAGNGQNADHIDSIRTATRKQGTLRAAVTTAVTGLALAAPLGPQPAQAAPAAPAARAPQAAPAVQAAPASLNPAALQNLRLDSATVRKVRAYDRYRTREVKQRRLAKKALRFARKQIGKPYRWGATGPDSYDCSGLVMAAWRKAGVQIPRVTHDQYRRVDRKVKRADLKPGDLVFFRGRNHVALYVGGGRYLHAPRTGTRVRIDRLDAWRRKQFAGAVRPGAPERRDWSPSVKELAERIDRMSTERKADQWPPDIRRSPQIPPSADPLPKTSDPHPAPAPAEQAGPPGRPANRPDDPAAQIPRDDGPSMIEPDPRPRTQAITRSPLRFRTWAEYAG